MPNSPSTTTSPKTGAKPRAIVPPITSPKIEAIAGRAVAHPEKLTKGEIAELGASVLRHIEPRKGGKA